ncbi:DUF6020 family protein [Butyrivibrio sp. INlla14]|uniref:DUF6020 family protein n=1 Tax=Butyrivibrio sp. INlla14 TaxID=1520808 RepID=UPI0008769C6C|nr:DUF6020 family protein [Butyrivibrio sp. INlla14]SCY25733.1 hypothetical protein SAMN02910371_01614 [Butyrivibrio sp. INlla14]
MEKSDLGKNKFNRNSKIAWLMSGLFGVLSGLFMVLGYQLENQSRINLADKNAMYIMALIMVVLTVDAKHVWDNYTSTFYGEKLMGLFRLDKYRASYGKSDKKSRFVQNWLLMMALNIPVLLGTFPGFFVYDAQDELNEVLTRTFTTHHPLLHVLLLGGTIALAHKITGSWNAGIFLYILLQMMVITAIFAYVTDYLYQKKLGKTGNLITCLYYGLFPTIVMFTLCSSKDGLFGAFLLLLTVFLFQMVEDLEGFLSSRIKVVLFISTAVLMPLFRHNGFYAYLVFVPFALFYFRKKIKSLVAPMLLIPVALYLIISGLFSGILSSEGTHHQEMLTVPIMQMARVYTYEPDIMTQEEKELLISYIPEENLKLYTPRVSDMVKVGFDNELYEKDSKSFWKLWKSLLVKKPMTYLNAWFLTSYGYWYPASVMNVYQGNTVFTFTYEDSSYFGYEVEAPGHRVSLIPALDSLYRYLSIGSFQQDAPVLALLFKPGCILLIYMFVLFYRLSRKSFSGVLPFMPMILTFLTVLLGPTYLVRYVVYLWTSLPLLLAGNPASNAGIE